MGNCLLIWWLHAWEIKKKKKKAATTLWLASCTQWALPSHLHPSWSSAKSSPSKSVEFRLAVPLLIANKVFEWESIYVISAWGIKGLFECHPQGVFPRHLQLGAVSKLNYCSAFALFWLTMCWVELCQHLVHMWSKKSSGLCLKYPVSFPFQCVLPYSDAKQTLSLFPAIWKEIWNSLCILQFFLYKLYTLLLSLSFFADGSSPNWRLAMQYHVYLLVDVRPESDNVRWGSWKCDVRQCLLLCSKRKGSL